MTAAPSPPTGSGPTRPSALFFVFLAAALLVFILTFKLLSPILLSLLLILLISLAINPVIARMRAWTGGRKGATALLALLVLGLIGLTGWAFVVPMKDSVARFSEELPEYWERLQKPLIKLERQAENSERKLQAEVATEIVREKVASGEISADSAAAVEALPLYPPDPSPSSAPKSEAESDSDSKSDSDSVRPAIVQMFQGVLGRFTAAAFNAAQILIVLVTVFFGVIYTLINPRPIFGVVFAFVPNRHQAQALTIMQRIGDFVPRWAAATLVGMITIGFLVFLIMWPLFGFMDALVLGLIAGIFAAIPFLGPVLSAVPALLLAFGEGGLTPLWVLLGYVGVQALEGNLILPMIMARGMKLHPVAVIFAMLLCVAAFGVLGVLVAAPLVAIANILHEELYRKRFLPLVTDDDLERLSREALHD